MEGQSPFNLDGKDGIPLKLACYLKHLDFSISFDKKNFCLFSLEILTFVFLTQVIFRLRIFEEDLKFHLLD